MKRSKKQGREVRKKGSRRVTDTKKQGFLVKIHGIPKGKEQLDISPCVCYI